MMMSNNTKCERQHKEITKNSLLIKILDKCNNSKLLSTTKNHVNTLLKYADKVSQLGSAAFLSREEYQEFAIAKFYVDKCIDALKSSGNLEIEEGEINSDAEDLIQKSDKSVKVNEEFPPLEAFHLSAEERAKRLFEFWKKVTEGEVYHAKVVNIADQTYDLILVNKYLDNERLIDLNIKAYMKKSNIKENLNVSNLVRVSICGYILVNGVYQLIVTADTAMLKVKLEDTKLGKISQTELPFPPIETCKFRSLTQCITAHTTVRDPKILLNNIKALGIDPYRTYCFHSELDGRKGEVMKPEKKGLSCNELRSIQKLKLAMSLKDKGCIPEAMTYANKALELNPKYDLAYVVRGTLFVMKANGKFSSLLLHAAKDFFYALELNSHCSLALEQISHLLSKPDNPLHKK